MTKQDIIDHLMHRCGLHGASAIAAVNGIIEILSRAIIEGDQVSLRGLGTIRTETRKARKAYDFHNEVTIDLPAKRVVKFIPSAEIKEQLKAQIENSTEG